MGSNSLSPPSTFHSRAEKLLSSQSPRFYAKATHNERTIVSDLEARMTESKLYSQTKMAIYEHINHCYEEGKYWTSSCPVSSNITEATGQSANESHQDRRVSSLVLTRHPMMPSDAWLWTVMSLHACMFVLLILPSSPVLHLLLLHLLPSTFAPDIPEELAGVWCTITVWVGQSRQKGLHLCRNLPFFLGLGCIKWWPNGAHQEGGGRCPSLKPVLPR